MKKSLILLPLFLLILHTGCKEVIDEVSFTVTVVNNTSEELTVFWNIDNGGFLEAGKVAPNGGTFEVRPVTIDTDNEIEVRKSDGTVVASGSYNQPDTTDRTLTVN